MKSVAINVLLAIREFMVREEIVCVAGDCNGTAWEGKGLIPIRIVLHNVAPLSALRGLSCGVDRCTRVLESFRDRSRVVH